MKRRYRNVSSYRSTGDVFGSNWISRLRAFARKLGRKSSGVPVLPGFNELPVAYAHDGRSSKAHWRARRGVDTLDSPMHAGEITFCK